MRRNHGDRELPKDPWTMTADEYREWEKAWTPDEHGSLEPDPYAERKMTPAEVEEWRKTCPYPEALGNMTESEMDEANREYHAREATK